MKKILIIDDDISLRETLVQALAIRSFETIEAENGRAGVRLALEHVPDLILSDIQMESFDGFAALAAVRYQPVTATIPFILMTGKPDESGRRMAMELGADDDLAKPFSIHSLVAAIQVQLKKREAIRQQSLNLKPSEADRDEVSAVAETATAPSDRQGIGEAEPVAPAAEENAGQALEVSLRMLNTYQPNLGGVVTPTFLSASSKAFLPCEPRSGDIATCRHESRRY